MSIEVESEQETYPAQDSLHNGRDSCLDEWRKNTRAHVTVIKCHIMASQGLTPEGDIIDPYPPDILLKSKENDKYLKDVDKEELDSYIASASSKLPAGDHCLQSDLRLDDVNVNIDEDAIDGTPLQSPIMKKSIFSMSKEASQEEPEIISLHSSSTNSADDNSDINHEAVENFHEFKTIKEELHKKGKEIEKLSKIRDEVENELQELTANLFQVG